MRYSSAVVGIVAAITVSATAWAGDPGRNQTFEARNSAARAPMAAPEPNPAGTVRVYRHPVRKFTLAIPADAEVAEREEGSQLSIRSRFGYIISVQTGDASPGVPLAGMVGKLEAQYLGQGRPWSQKLRSGKIQVAGLEAIESDYAGAGTRVKVVIARGQETDFVFMFFAPTDSFEDHVGRFDWWLANFNPDGSERVAQGPGRAPAAAAPAPAASGPKRFAEAGYGYSIQYPGDWQMEKPSTTLTAFSGQAGSEAYDAIVSIENVRPEAAKTPDETATAALADLKAVLSSQAVDLTVIGERPLTYKNGALSLFGRQMVVTYSYGGQRYRKWALVVPRPNGTIAHVWSYTAPETRFNAFRPFADAMLRSWTIRPEDG